MNDPRDTPQYIELMKAHHLCETVLIFLERQGHKEHASDIRTAMKVIARWIPCNETGTPSRDCKCHDCEEFRAIEEEKAWTT